MVDYKDRLLAEKSVRLEEAVQLALLEGDALRELYELAEAVTRRVSGNGVELCAIINARSGRCTEDCRFCAQSAHYPTSVDIYPLIPAEKALDKALRMEEYGVKRFSLVTSGRGMRPDEVKEAAEIFHSLRKKTELELCASFGIIGEEEARQLKDAGVSMYHHNLEASRSFFPNVCTTHTYSERVETIKAARRAGLRVCAGGIIGLGETMSQRLELAAELNKLGIDSVPVNILNPIAGTPLEGISRPTKEEVLRTLALFRLILPDAVIRLCGGREPALGEHQVMALRVAVNGLMVGNYLTTHGNGILRDLDMLAEAKLKVLRPAG